MASSRTCSIRRRTWSSARSSCANEPGRCIPVSTSTIPSPAAIAQALQCGTPGQGSGRRRRHRPGSTRSPRPTSRGRGGLMARDIRGEGHRVGRSGLEFASMSTATEGRTATALRYFQALADRDAGAMAACWRPGGIDRFVGQADLTAPDEVRDYFQALFDAFPDLEAEVLQTTTEGNRCAVRWRVRGTFAGPGSFQGLEPNGARVEMEGCDVVEVEDGQVVGNSAYMDGAAVARQIGALPAQGSPAERRLAALFNRGARLRRRIAGDEPEAIADGVWIVRGGFPLRTMNCYLIRDGAGVCVFDAGIHSMAPAIAAAGARLGGITRVVLGHAHPDHRGAAAALDAPVYCHPADRADA